MYLFLFENSNLLLGFVPETLGLLLFGLALVAVTVGIRWFFGDAENDNTGEENLEVLVSETNQ